MNGIRTIGFAAAAVAGIALTSHAQSFDEGSFETGSNSAGKNPGGSTGVASADGFDEGSFDDGGSSVGGGVVANEPVGGDGIPGNIRPDVGGSGAVTPEPSATPPLSRIDPLITAFETRDFGVPPQNTLRQGQFHAPTPVALPGANLVTTSALVDAMNGNVPMVLIDVLGGDYSLPGAYSAPALASTGSFNDRTQQQAGIWLQQITGGQRDLPIVIFCSDPMCWLSYNASLRTVAAGFVNVYWYRGGLTAWQMAGQPMQPIGF